MSNVRCSSCQVEFPSSQLECHISTDHLDYYPYGCGHCGHWLPTDDLAHFHAAKKQHLPIKIHEKPDIAKERRLHQIIDSSKAGEPLPADSNDFGDFSNYPWQHQFGGNSNSASPASVNAAGSAENQSPAAAEAPMALEDLQGTSSASMSSANIEQRPIFTETHVDMEAFELNDSSRSCRSYANSENSCDREDKPVNVQISIKDVAANPALFQKSINVHARKKTKPRGLQDKKSRKSQMFSMNMEEAKADMTGDELTEFTQKTSNETKICNICQMKLYVTNVENHVNRHLATRPLAACNYCGYKGRSLNSVRVHITWKHPGKPTKTGMGAKDLSHVDATEETMYDRCFGEQESQAICADPDAVPKSIGMLRPFAKRAAKTIGTTGPDKQLKMQLQSPPNLFMQPPNPVSTATGPLGLLVTRTSQSASGRLYKHMICQECGQECLDALASAHVYAAHINMKDMVQCPYCDYGVAYAISEVKRHISAKHPDKPVRVIDKRQEPEMQELYIHWRTQCFPEIGSRRSVGAGFQTPPTMVVSTSKKDLSDNADKLLNQLFGRKRPMNDLPPAARAPMDVDQTQLMTPEALTQSAFSALGANKDAIDAGESAKSLNARMKQTCSICGAEITSLWLHRHVWKHLSDEYEINPFKCAFEHCEFSTYLRRSLDSHCAYHGAGYTTEQLGAIDERHKYSNQFMKCMVDCFGPDVPDAMFGDSYFSSPAIGVQKITRTEQPSTMLTSQQNPVVPRMEQHIQMHPKDLSKVPRPEQMQPLQLHSNVLSPGRIDLFNVMSQEQRDAFDRQPVITATPMDAWCQKCQCGFARDEADDHVWQAHLGGVQPFRCGRCLKSFLELTQMENHWTSEHSRCNQTGEMEVIEEPDAMCHFENMIVECFPDLAAHRSAIKIEVDTDEIEH